MQASADVQYDQQVLERLISSACQDAMAVQYYCIVDATSLSQYHSCWRISIKFSCADQPPTGLPLQADL